MDKFTLHKRSIILIALIYFFFLAMLFLFLNISNLMYTNAGIKLATTQAKNLRFILLNQLSFDHNQLKLQDSKKIDAFLSQIDLQPPLYFLKIYTLDKKIIYQKGRDILLEKKIKVNINDIKQSNLYYQKTFIKNKRIPVYEFIILLQQDQTQIGYLDLLFNIQDLEQNFFKEKKTLLLIVFFFNFMIIFFQLIMIINLQRKIYLAKQEIDNIIVNDKITHLYTRENFINLLIKELERQAKNNGTSNIILADIDNFYSINEKFGYEFGDLILKTVADIFLKSFRSFDFVGRYGGDEIIILMVDSDENIAYKAAEVCRKAVEENKFYYNGKEITITLSCGITSTAGPDFQVKKIKKLQNSYYKTMIHHAYKALNQAKRSGKNQIIKYSSLISFFL